MILSRLVFNSTGTFAVFRACRLAASANPIHVAALIPGTRIGETSIDKRKEATSVELFFTGSSPNDLNYMIRGSPTHYRAGQPGFKRNILFCCVRFSI